MSLISKKTEAVETDTTLTDALSAARAGRDSAHSVEMRQVVALEQIADELTTLRVHLTSKAKG